jgi:ligand-binding sensor domain-containing protein
MFWFAWLSVAALSLVATSFAQGPARRADVIFEQLDRNNGLPSPIVQALAQDGDGFLWVGTGSGVSRWDGYRFRNYQFQVGVAGALPDNDIYSMYTDPRRTLWIGTRSRGVARYDAVHDRFQTFAPPGKNQEFPTVYAMVSDGAGGLLVGSRRGIDHLDPVTGTFTPVTLEGTTGQVPVMGLARDRTGRMPDMGGDTAGRLSQRLSRRTFHPAGDLRPGDRSGLEVAVRPRRPAVDRNDCGGLGDGAFRAAGKPDS